MNKRDVDARGTAGARKKAERIRLQLAELYPAPPIPLDHSDPFTLLIAVLMSAQTTDARVNMVTPALFARAPHARAMAELPVEEILAFIRTVGLAPTKARNVSALSHMLMEKYGGQVPRDMALLEELPGVGHKTASVVMAQAFGVPAFPVDTHIHRLAARWGLSDGSSVVRTEEDLKRLYAPEHWNPLHLQIIYFGREHCPALRHDQGMCPICSWAAPRGSHAPLTATAARPASKKAARRLAGSEPAASRPVRQAKPGAAAPGATPRADQKARIPARKGSVAGPR
jgi:endonuclease-3